MRSAPCLAARYVDLGSACRASEKLTPVVRQVDTTGPEPDAGVTAHQVMPSGARRPCRADRLLYHRRGGASRAGVAAALPGGGDHRRGLRCADRGYQRRQVTSGEVSALQGQPQPSNTSHRST